MPNYSEMLKELGDELARLTFQRDEIAAQIERLKTAIESVQDLAAQSDEPLVEAPPMPPDVETGFTDRVRAILKANPTLLLTAVLIRDEFLKGSPYEDAKILLIHTHNTLKRLHRQGEVDEGTTSAGKGYRWKFSPNAFANTYRLAEQLDRERKTFGQRIADGPPKPPDFIEDALKSMTKKK